MTVELANPVTATMAILKADPIVALAMGDTVRVHGGEIPSARASAMPERCIVVTTAGSPPMAPGNADNVPVSVRRVDVRCYGRTRSEADLLAISAQYVLKGWRYGRTSNRALVHWYRQSGGPTAFRDPEGDWPVSVVTFTLQLADELAAAA